jgi:hypothetical protein
MCLIKTSSKLLIMATILIYTLSAGSAFAASLAWNACSGDVDGYKVYYGTNATNPSSMINVGDVTQYSIDSLPLNENQQYYFCVSAYNAAGESDPCAPVAYTPADTTPPSPPVGLAVD